MYYSVTFTSSEGVKRNTWQDWHLVPTSPPMVAPPEPYTNYVEIPGRIEGPIDLSEVLTGGPSYQNSEGSWEFVLVEGYYPRPETYQMLKKFLHGRQMKIELEEDPLHYYIGRLTIEQPSTGRGNSSFTINYVIRPVRYNLDGTKDGV